MLVGAARRGNRAAPRRCEDVGVLSARAASHARPVARRTPPRQELLACARAGRLASWGLPARRAAPGERELGTVRGSPPAVQCAVFWETSVIFARSCQRVALRAASEPQSPDRRARLQHAQPSICSAAAFRSTAHSPLRRLGRFRATATRLRAVEGRSNLFECTRLRAAGGILAARLACTYFVDAPRALSKRSGPQSWQFK